VNGLTVARCDPVMKEDFHALPAAVSRGKEKRPGRRIRPRKAGMDKIHKMLSFTFNTFAARRRQNLLDIKSVAPRNQPVFVVVRGRFPHREDHLAT
jgi:hypothetical protein